MSQNPTFCENNSYEKMSFLAEYTLCDAMSLMIKVN
jgi:hypothetical protein